MIPAAMKIPASGPDRNNRTMRKMILGCSISIFLSAFQSETAARIVRTLIVNHPPDKITAGKIVRIKSILFENAFGQIPAQSNLTANHDRTVSIQFCKALAKLSEGKIDRAGDGTSRILSRLADIQNQGVFRKIFRIY